MKARELLAACFVLFGALLLWPLLTIANRPVLVWAVLAIVLGYLLFLFLVASVGEAFAARLSRGRIRTVTYVLAASVYCTAWTFYGSVGLAANRGLEFLTIYLGPACVALLWPVLLRKLV